MQEYEAEEKPKKKSFFNLDFIFLKMTGLKKNNDTLPDYDSVVVRHAKPEKTQEEIQQLKQEREQNYKVLAQQEQASKFLNANLYKLYFSMINNGYKPTEGQQEVVDNTLSQLFSKMNKNFKHFKEINVFIEQGYKLNSSNVYELLSNKHFQSAFFSEELFNADIDFIDFIKNKKTVKSENNEPVVNSTQNSAVLHDFFPIFEQIRHTIFTEDFSQYAAKRVLLSIHSNFDYEHDEYYYDDSEYTQQYPFLIKELFNAARFLEVFPHIILPSISLDNLINFMGEIQEKDYYINSMYEDAKSGYKQYAPAGQYNIQSHFNQLCNGFLDTYYSKDVNHLLDSTKVIYSNSYLEDKAIKTTTGLSNNYKVNNLPNSSQDLVKDIQLIYSQLQNHNSSFTPEHLFTINNIFDKRIPEVLQKYFSIDLDYRTNLKNSEGKNAQELMDDSLTNYKQKLTNILDNINENKLSDLSVSKRYSQKI